MKKGGEERLEALKKAAEDGEVGCQRDLAQLYYDGRGGQKPQPSSVPVDQGGRQGGFRAAVNLLVIGIALRQHVRFYRWQEKCASA